MGGNADEGSDRQAAAARDEVLQRFELQAGMLHVEQDEVGPGCGGDGGHAGREEFEHHWSKRAFVLRELLLDGLYSHLAPPQDAERVGLIIRAIIPQQASRVEWVGGARAQSK